MICEKSTGVFSWYLLILQIIVEVVYDLLQFIPHLAFDCIAGSVIFVLNFVFSQTVAVVRMAYFITGGMYTLEKHLTGRQKVVRLGAGVIFHDHLITVIGAGHSVIPAEIDCFSGIQPHGFDF